MLQQLKRWFGYALVGGIAAGMASTFIACEFKPRGVECNGPGCPVDYTDGHWIPLEVDLLVETSPVTTPTENQRWTNDIYEGPIANSFRYRADHGKVCAKANKGWVELGNGDDVIGVQIEDSAPLSYPMDQGMVILNGYHLEYQGNDHHLLGMSAWISDVQLVQRKLGYTLRWKAGAVLGDKNGDDAYRFCIYYTVVSWDSNTIDAYVIQDNVDHSQTLVTPNSLAADGETTAQIHLLQGQQEGPFLRAVVPRGFHLIYNDKLEDHHVFQVGFDFTDRMFPGLLHDISWDSLAILKDKSTRPFIAAEMISLVGGRGAGWKWGYATRSSLQRRSRSDCQTADVNSGYHSEWISIPDVTFHHAVPILSMWDTGDICTDHHVQVIGVRIADWSYDPPEGDSTGTLHVQVESAFQDNGGNFSSRGSTANYKVNVLGFNRD